MKFSVAASFKYYYSYFVESNTVVPEVEGMSLLNAENGKIIQPVAGITTALEVFDQRSVTAVRPQPKIVVLR